MTFFLDGLSYILSKAELCKLNCLQPTGLVPLDHMDKDKKLACVLFMSAGHILGAFRMTYVLVMDIHPGVPKW